MQQISLLPSGGQNDTASEGSSRSTDRRSGLDDYITALRSEQRSLHEHERCCHSAGTEPGIRSTGLRHPRRALSGSPRERPECVYGA